MWSIAFSSDSRLLALGCWDGTATVYRISQARAGWRSVRDHFGIVPSTWLFERTRLSAKATSNAMRWRNRSSGKSAEDLSLEMTEDVTRAEARAVSRDLRRSHRI